MYGKLNTKQGYIEYIQVGVYPPSLHGVANSVMNWLTEHSFEFEVKTKECNWCIFGWFIESDYSTMRSMVTQIENLQS